MSEYNLTCIQIFNDFFPFPVALLTFKAVKYLAENVASENVGYSEDHSGGLLGVG